MEKAVELKEELKIENNGISVRVSEDKMKAYLIMERPNEGGRRTEADLMAIGKPNLIKEESISRFQRKNCVRWISRTNCCRLRYRKTVQERKLTA